MNYGEKFDFPMMDFNSFKVQPRADDPMFNPLPTFGSMNNVNLIQHNVGDMLNEPSLKNCSLIERYGWNNSSLNPNPDDLYLKQGLLPEIKIRKGNALGESHHIKLY